MLLVMPTGVRQVALLPAARDRARRHDAGDQPADRADGRSGRQAQGARLRRRAHPLRPRPRGLAPGLHRLPERQAAIPVHRAGAAARGRLPGDAGEAQAVADRHRRGALHLAMGARLPARLPHARPVPAHAAARAGDRADRDGDAARAERHRRAAGARRSRRASSTASAATTSRSRWSKSRRRSAAALARELLDDEERRPGDRLRAHAQAGGQRWPRNLAATFPPPPITPASTPSSASACRSEFLAGKSR